MPLTLTLTSTPYSGLIAIAKAKGFFKEQGLHVQLVECPSGKAGVEALIQGKVDVAAAADFVFSDKIRVDPALRLFASIGLSRGDQVVARKDRGIGRPKDLEGKSVGVTKGTSADYNLEIFLLLHKVDPATVRVVDLPPVQLVQALQEGEIDAAATWDRLAYEAKKILKENFFCWDLQNTIAYQWVLISREGFGDKDGRVRRLLRALLQAETYILLHKEEAFKIIQATWDFDQEYFSDSWEKTRLTVSLNQGLITSLENQVRWRKLKEPTGKDIPDILDYISLTPLLEEDPKAVTILR
ncbi:ABC transporter substrate-binding protein [Solidesulfovibrio carbinoliphilus]|uniref:ABC transporter substrate-binding protein n=1 Tax=Solidesulfovibrio carbinoliphilus TaxID=345370 RepID=UPI0012F484D4|nr:ABC transporter substrate-binding protein [Solidesulfovibrio carbinoliphilus]